MSDLFAQPQGATPLDPAERQGLRPTWIATQGDLNAAEEDNILKGAAWSRGAGRRRDILDTAFVKALHARMFGDVWRWAGEYRLSDRNLGVPPHRIAPDVAALLGDAEYWIAHATWPRDEIAVRLHHRLVAIHPFVNGNGRHARLLADLLIERLGAQPFSWGGTSLAETGALRAAYIAALKAADAHDHAPLVAFARG